MNSSDQAGTIMACLVWLLLGMYRSVCLVCYSLYILTLLYIIHYYNSLLGSHCHIFGKNGWYSRHFILHLLCALCLGIGQSCQDDLYRSRVRSHFRRTYGTSEAQ